MAKTMNAVEIRELLKKIESQLLSVEAPTPYISGVVDKIFNDFVNSVQDHFDPTF